MSSFGHYISRQAGLSLLRIATRHAAIVAIPVASMFACSEPVVIAEMPADDAGVSAPALGSGADAGAQSPNETFTAMCATDKCPAGRATCPDSPFPCGVDLSSDDDNCGACGNRCPDLDDLNAAGLGYLHLATTCVDGICRPTCAGTVGSFADCNGLAEDGCEIHIDADPKNCGGCGIVCSGLDACIRGQCTCPIDGSCGECGNVCPPSEKPPFPDDWHAAHGCGDGECDKSICIQTLFNKWEDCNGNFPSPEGDGCEIDLQNDRNNCGACGRVCGPGERCSMGRCVCPCGEVCFTLDLFETDPQNCGGCGVTCGGVDGNSVGICDHGLCDLRCTPDWMDCDHDSRNGCETNVGSDPLNCGGCGIRCDGVDAQACVDGKCTTEECGIVQ